METDYTGALRLGATGPEVKKLQAWLCLSGGNQVVVDGQFGKATEHAVSAYQQALPPMSDRQTGVVDEDTWAELSKPMTEALICGWEPLPTLAEETVAIAQKHLASNPREVGGENCGPWVRLYMNGREGRSWPWCCGCATWFIDQASKRLKVKPTVPYTTGCDWLYEQMRRAGRVLDPSDTAVKAGDLFLVQSSQYHYSHIGIIESLKPDGVVTTLEGNTNDSGSPEGYEFCRRTRTLAGKVVIAV